MHPGSCIPPHPTTLLILAPVVITTLTLGVTVSLPFWRVLARCPSLVYRIPPCLLLNFTEMAVFFDPWSVGSNHMAEGVRSLSPLVAVYSSSVKTTQS